MKIHLWLSLIFGLSPFSVFAQTAETIAISTQDYALVLQVDGNQRLQQVHFGKKLANEAEYAAIAATLKQDPDNQGIPNNAYTPAGTWNLFEPAFSVKHADGNPSSELKFQGKTVEKTDSNVSLTRLTLRDPLYPVQVVLCFKAYAAENVIEQWTEISHTEKQPIVLGKYASANLYFSAKNYYLKHYHGKWAMEMQPEETQLAHGVFSLDTKLGARANLFQPPSFQLSFDRPATETEGKVMLANLAWSGNFKIDFELDTYENLRLIAGINPYASSYQLAPGQVFRTPALIYCYSENGTGEASRNLHRWARTYRIPDGNGDRLTLLNNWEATYFDFDEAKLTGLFAGAKKLGVDLFLLDDGWFGNKYPRNNDQAGLGDWQENKKKLPHGLGYLVKEASKAGVKFGIWVEPEMVNPKSVLYEKHPEWVIRQPERPEVYYRNQLVLDLSNPEVQDFVFGVLDHIFTENPDLAFVKWDCNAVIYNAQSAYLEKQKLPQDQLYVDYVLGLYKVLDRLRAKYPRIPMMLCSGGGGRVDYGALQYFTEFWLSDNTDPLERVFQQWEYSYFFPAIAHCDHITDWSRVGLKYRTDVAMMGKMGYDIVVDHLTADELTFSQQALRNYRENNDLVWHGDLYRLLSPWENPFAALMFVSPDKARAMMFNYVVTNRYDISYSPNPVKLSGLDPQKRYRITEINLFPGAKSTLPEGAVYSGDFLMNVGLNPDMNRSRTSVVLSIVAI